VLLSSGVPVVTRKIESADHFDELFASNYGVLTRLIYRVVGDIGWAEELAAEAFWKLHCKPPTSNHNLVGWLYRTGLPLQQHEQQARVRHILAALKPEQAVLLVLRSEGYSHGEIASTLCLNPSSVGTLLARADISFRKEYVNRYGER